ncbi:ATPase, T2SS/T4P/T4SS family [Castellaniella sp. UC4442_H9]
MTRLCDIDFLDLYLGHNVDGLEFADIKGLSSVSPEFTPAGAELADEIAAVRDQCERQYATGKRREFSFLRDDVLYRVAVFETSSEGLVYTLRQKKREERRLEDLGLSMATQRALQRPDMVGAVLVVGPMSSGKTVTISTSIKTRLEQMGGLALVLEDPIETRLSGQIGHGRALQIEVEQAAGGYTGELQRGMRSNADMFMIGEIRNGPTAFDFLLGGSNGHLLFSTTHGMSIEHGLIRLSSMIEMGHAEIAELMSQGLSMVIHQSIVRTERRDRAGFDSRMLSQTLIVSGAPNETAIRSKIKAGNFASLRDEIKNQQAAALHATRL